MLNILKKKSKRVLIYFVLLFKTNKVANKLLKYLLRQAPSLEEKIRRIYSSIIYSISSQEVKSKTTDVSNLSFTARQIYTQLGRAIEKHHGDKQL